MSYGKRLEGCLSHKMIENEVKTPLCREGGKGNKILSVFQKKVKWETKCRAELWYIQTRNFASVGKLLRTKSKGGFLIWSADQVGHFRMCTTAKKLQGSREGSLREAHSPCCCRSLTMWSNAPVVSFVTDSYHNVQLLKEANAFEYGMKGCALEMHRRNKVWVWYRFQGGFRLREESHFL